MIPYLCILLLIVLQGILLLRKNNNRSTRLFFFLIWLEFTLIAAFRSVNVGRDTVRYFSMFNYVSHVPDLVYLSTHMERGFLLFNKLISSIYDSPQFLFFVIGGTYTYVFLRIINKFSPWRLVSIIIFFSAVPFGSYVFGLTFLRQALAISCFLFGLEKLLENKRISFVLWILCGMIFHKSAILCLILLPLQKQKINFLTLVAVFLGTIFMMGFLPWIISHLPFGLGRYSSYMTWEIGEMSSLMAFFKAMFQLYVSVTLLYVYLSKQDTSTTTLLFVWISLLAFVCELFAVRILFMNRLLYFTACNCFLIPYALAHVKRKKELISFSLVFILVFVFNNTEFWMYRAHREHLDQYEFYWDNPYGIVRWNLYG